MKLSYCDSLKMMFFSVLCAFEDVFWRWRAENQKLAYKSKLEEKYQKGDKEQERAFKRRRMATCVPWSSKGSDGLEGGRWYPEPWGPCQHKPNAQPNSPPQSFAPSRVGRGGWRWGGGEGLMKVWTGRRRDTPAPWRSLRQLIFALTMIAPVKITAKIHSQPGTG